MTSLISRESLMKTAGAAMAAFLCDAGSAQGAPQPAGSKCCGPIDMMFKANLQSTAAGGVDELLGIRITDKDPSLLSEGDLQVWKPMHHLRRAAVSGYDEYSVGHGAGGDSDVNHAQPLGYDLWIYHQNPAAASQ